jgi:hypothetical protein
MVCASPSGVLNPRAEELLLSEVMVGARSRIEARSKAGFRCIDGARSALLCNAVALNRDCVSASWDSILVTMTSKADGVRCICARVHQHQPFCYSLPFLLLHPSLAFLQLPSLATRTTPISDAVLKISVGAVGAMV